MRQYAIFCDNYKITADALITEFERRGLTIPASLNDLITYGSGYSNQDFDVLSSAIRTLAGGNDILPVYQTIGTYRA